MQQDFSIENYIFHFFNHGSNYLSSVEPLTGNEDDVEEWFNQYDRIAYANEWSREEKGRKLPVWLKEKALNIWYDLEQIYKHNYEI
ncbi:hypothetical protein BpHYR1_052502, partial [Brachionus plicatilis]